MKKHSSAACKGYAVTAAPTVRELDNASPVKEMVLTPGSDLDFYFPDASTLHKRSKALPGETGISFLVCFF